MVDAMEKMQRGILSIMVKPEQVEQMQANGWELAKEPEQPKKQAARKPAAKK